MQIQASLQELLKTNTDVLLKKGVDSPGKVRSLQGLLHGLGYSNELKWEAYRADGDYGGGTTTALQAFQRANGLSGDGTQLDPLTLQKLLDRYALLPLLREVKKAREANQLAALFAGTDGANKAAQLQKAAGVRFAASVPTTSETDQALAALEPAYGKEWRTSSLEDDPTTTDLTVETQSNRYVVGDSWVRIKFNRKDKGVWTIGSDTPLAFIQTNAERLMANGLTESDIRVITPVSANEGNLNAINSWDNCYLTFGMFQWTLGVGSGKGELPALLLRIRNDEPEAFQQYFGQYGIDLVDTNKTTGYLSLNGEKISSPAAKEKFRKGPEWAFRFWRAGLDDRIKFVQIAHALDRINSFWHSDDYRPLNKFYISDLVTSEYGICLLLDHHVNRPGHLASYAIGKKDIVGQALKQADLAGTSPSTWTTAEETRLLGAYLPLRYASSMTHGKERAAKIQNYLEKGRLSGERFSYQPAPAAVQSRSLDAPVEAEYGLINFSEYTRRKRVHE